jgi:hypothetical protein
MLTGALVVLFYGLIAMIGAMSGIGLCIALGKGR